MLDLFIDAVNKNGLPNRVRSNQGLENVAVARYMIDKRGPETRSMIVGSSTYNQCIEHLWRDMHKGVTVLFYKLFYFMEEQGTLDPLNEFHLWALHYVYLAKINTALAEFVAAWNNHSIRTAHHHSPQQLFTSGVLLLRHSNSEALDYAEDVDDNYGDDEDELIPDDDSEGVPVPRSQVRFSESDIGTLKAVVDPNAPSREYGVDLYEPCLQYIATLTPVSSN